MMKLKICYLELLMIFLNKKLEYVTNIKMENKFTNKYLRRILFQWPKINEKYIRKYVAYLKSIGHIE